MARDQMHQMTGIHRIGRRAIATLAGLLSAGMVSTAIVIEFSRVAWSNEGAIADEIAAAPRHLPPQLMSIEDYPLELDLLDPDADRSDRNVITDDMISQQGLTTPSLWWTQRQFGGKLLEHWLAYPGSPNSPRRVDLVVDRQLWGLSTYLERYTFVNQFGTAAKEFGYSLRVFNDQGAPLASYACNFPSFLNPDSLPSNDDPNDLEGLSDSNSDASVDASEGNPAEMTAPITFEPEELSCNITLDSSGAGALRGRTTTFEIFF